MSEYLSSLLELLKLEQVERNLFRAHHPPDRKGRLYGGQIMAQALMGAALTVDDDRAVHSLHGYFLRPGDPKIPALIKVERLRDGGSFSFRRVVVIQHGEAIFNLDASFQVREQGLEHQFEMPDMQPPSADKIPAYVQESAFISWRFEFRRLQSSTPQPPEQFVWFKANGKVPKDPVLSACLLVFESDSALLGTSRLPHRGNYKPEKMQVASLDHTMWFHHEVDLSDWMLYALDAPSSSGGRGVNRGTIYTREGKLIASTVQEGLIRLK